MKKAAKKAFELLSLVVLLVVVLFLNSNFNFKDHFQPQQTQISEYFDRVKMENAFKKLVAQHGGERVELDTLSYLEVKKILGGDEDQNNLAPLCSAQFNFDPADQWVRITDTVDEISFLVPFNEKWGNEYLKPPVYTQHFNHIGFGPISTAGEGGCAWGRQYGLTFRDKASAKEVVRAAGSELVRPAEIKKLSNSIEIVEILSYGLCPSDASVVIIGKEHNYELSSFCGSEDDFPFFEKIAETIELL